VYVTSIDDFVEVSKLSMMRWLPNRTRSQRLLNNQVPSKRTSKLVIASLIASLLYSVSISSPPATAIAANPTPVCSGAYCTISFTFSGDFNNWTVPAGITSIYVVVQGASGGRGLNAYNSNPGFGAEMKGDVAVTAGNVLRVQVGGQGQDRIANNNAGGGGGGGGASFISNTSTSPATPLVVAGGGGGGPGACCGTSAVQNGINASLTTSGTNGNPNSVQSPWYVAGIGGVNGLGGGVGNINNAGSGAGWVGNGLRGNSGTVATALIDGGAGGAAASLTTSGRAGGYGGGGAGHAGSGGGGGGYSGGGGASASSNWAGGGGGGSYSVATSQSNVVRNAYGNGSISIKYLNAPTPTTFSTTQTSPTKSASAFTYSIVMSQNVTGMGDADFSNAGTATGCVFSVNASSGTNFTLTVSSCGEGTVIPQLIANSVYGTVTATNGPGNNAQTTTPVTRDITSPTISSVTAPTSATYSPISTAVNFTVNFSEAVLVTGTPRLTLTVGTATRYANYLSGSGTSALVFRYTVASDINEVDVDGISATSPIDLNGGTLADAATNNSSLTYTAPTLTGVLVVQPPSAPTINSISASSGALSIAFTAGTANGSTITNYQYSLNGGGWTNRSSGTTASPIDITGLVNGTGYTVAIRAVNAAGNGTASATSASVTVQAGLGISGGGNITTNYGTSSSVTFSSLYGTGTKVFSIKKTSDNSQVTGITINGLTGVVTASATTLPGIYSMTVTVTDAANATASTTMTITINTTSLTIRAASPANIFYGGTKAADTFTATGLNALDSISGITYTYRGTGLTSYGPSATAPTQAGSYSITPSAATFVDAASAARIQLLPTPQAYLLSIRRLLTVTPTNQVLSMAAAASLLWCYRLCQ
jgi:hypothetical protein